MPCTKSKEATKYVVTFGIHHYETKFSYATKSSAEKKANQLKRDLQHISFQVKKKVKK